MTSTSVPLGNSNDDDGTGAYSQHQPKQRVQSLLEQSAFGTPNFVVLGGGPGVSRNRTQYDQRHTTAQSQGGNGVENDTQLLQHLSNDFGHLLNRTDLSDCFLNVGSTYMAVHRCVLAARSSTFAAVVSGNIHRLDNSTRTQLKTSTEEDKLIISIDNTDPQIMKEVVIFLYTAKCELNEGNAYALLDAAGRYDIKSLKVHTGLFLAKHIDTNNVLRLIEAAYKYDNVLVKHECIGYFIDHAKEIMDITEPWKLFAERYPSIVADLLYWRVNKDEFHKKLPQTRSISQW